MTFPVPNNRGTQSFLGWTSDQNPVGYRNNFYLSNEGITLRHFKQADRGVQDGIDFWDEVIVATQEPSLINPDAPLHGRDPANFYPS